METFIIGDVVISTKGHDKNLPFIVSGIDKNQNPVIIDGRFRKRAKPKTKNPKHLKKVGHDEKIIEKINSTLSTDAEIYKLIKAYKEKE